MSADNLCRKLYAKAAIDDLVIKASQTWRTRLQKVFFAVADVRSQWSVVSKNNELWRLLIPELFIFRLFAGTSESTQWWRTVVKYLWIIAKNNAHLRI